MGEDYEPDYESPEDDWQSAAALMLSLLLRLLRRGDVLLRFVRGKAHLLDDRVCPGLDSATIIGRVLLEVGEDCFADDDPGHGVGHKSASAVARRDRDLSFLRSNYQQNAIVVFRTAE